MCWGQEGAMPGLLGPSPLTWGRKGWCWVLGPSPGAQGSIWCTDQPYATHLDCGPKSLRTSALACYKGDSVSKHIIQEVIWGLSEQICDSQANKVALALYFNVYFLGVFQDNTVAGNIILKFLLTEINHQNFFHALWENCL